MSQHFLTKPGSIKSTYFFSLLFVTLSLFPLGAHLLELPNKIVLSLVEYRTIQQIYRGWAWTGIVIFCSLAATLTLTLQLRGQAKAFLPALLSVGCIALSQVVFWVFTFPVNQRTENWTVFPTDWAELRSRWEYSHMISAVLVLAAAIALFISVLRFSSVNGSSE